MQLTPYGRFDSNEIFVILSILITYFIFYLIPRRLDREIVFLLFVWGIAVANLMDFTIGGGMFDYYDIMDSPRYEPFDFISLFMYAPFSFFFIYLYEHWKIKGLAIGIYIVAWSIFSLGFEWLLLFFKVITYKNGYIMWVSFIIYLLAQSMTILFYRWIRTPS
jgi:hypothetical protein